MKKRILLTTIVAVLLMAGPTWADSLSVTQAAALGGTYGLEISHGGTNTGAFVVDDTPAGEQIYRFSFLINPNGMVGDSSLTPILFRAKGDNPNPGGGRCPVNALAQVDSIAIRAKFLQQGYSLQLRINDNFCGARGTADVPISPNTPSKVCCEVQHAAAGQGVIAIAIVDVGNACPPTGDPSYVTVANSNSSVMEVNRISLGIHETHPASRHVNPMYLDEFESFRTLAP